MSHVIIEVAGVLGITLKHATTKIAQTIGLLERSHASIEQALEIETSGLRSLWHKHVNIAVLNYNTSYNASIGCEPAAFFTAVFPIIIWIENWEFTHSNSLFPLHKLPKMFLIKQI